MELENYDLEKSSKEKFDDGSIIKVFCNDLGKLNKYEEIAEL